jgi:hypothetical protein
VALLSPDQKYYQKNEVLRISTSRGLNEENIELIKMKENEREAGSI